jgi:signal transduction histidine kinase
MKSSPHLVPADRPEVTRPRGARAGRLGRDRAPAAVPPVVEDTAAAVSAAIERERARTGAWLHDTVLQVLEFVAAGGYADEPDPSLMAGAAARAADDLRAAIEGELPLTPGTLVEQLHAVVSCERKLAAHKILLQVGQIDPPPPLPGTEQLVAAAGEALRNARKHAVATRVIVWCEVLDGLATVVVEDDGVGFDPTSRRGGAGLRRSIVGRLEHEGGRATIDSRPGAGTRVLLQLRLTPAQPVRAAGGARR